MESVRFQQMEKVSDLAMEGMNETEIAKHTGLKRKEVITLLDDWRTALSNDTEARDMARDHLNMMGKHYDKLIKKFYELIEELNTLSFNHQVAGQKNSAIKAIAELEAKRLDAFRQAGLLDSAELGDELAKWEEEKDMVIGILKSDLCPACTTNISHKIAKLTGDVPAINVDFDYDVVPNV